MSYPNQDDENNTSQEKDSQLKAQKEMMLKQVLSADARLRLNNVRMVKPDLADLVENYILNVTAQGKISGQISDDQLKQILLSAQQPKRDFKFNRVWSQENIIKGKKARIFMKAVVYREYAPDDDYAKILKVEDIDEPKPKQDEVIFTNKASALN